MPCRTWHIHGPKPRSLSLRHLDRRLFWLSILLLSRVGRPAQTRSILSSRWRPCLIVGIRHLLPSIILFSLASPRGADEYKIVKGAGTCICGSHILGQRGRLVVRPLFQRAQANLVVSWPAASLPAFSFGNMGYAIRNSLQYGGGITRQRPYR